MNGEGRTDTHDWAVQTCRVGDRYEGCVYVVKIYLASCLKFVDEIQKAEREGGAGLFQCCGKPSHTKELDARWILFSRISAVTVADANNRNPGDIEKGQVHGRGRERTAVANTMSELVRGTEIE